MIYLNTIYPIQNVLNMILTMVEWLSLYSIHILMKTDGLISTYKSIDLPTINTYHGTIIFYRFFVCNTYFLKIIAEYHKTDNKSFQI